MSVRVTLCLCMAGRYRRFREANYTTPKFLLPVRAKTILQLVLEPLADAEHVLLVANERERAHEESILDVLRVAGVQGRLLFTQDTSGQAATAALGAEVALQQGWLEPILFHNIDTILLGRDLRRIDAVLREADGYIDVFRASSQAYSYVEVEPESGERRIRRIAEKVVISDLATTGLYGFSSPEAYLERTQTTSARSAGEFYISDVYRAMIQAGDTVLAGRPEPGHRTVILGTPAEYEGYLGSLS